MSQIMRLRRRAGNDFHIDDRNNGSRHEESFTTLVRDNGLLHEAELLPRSFGGNSWFGKFAPSAGAVLLKSLPAIVPAVLRGKVSIKTAMLGHKIDSKDLSAIKNLFNKVESRKERIELNLYVVGEEDQPEPAPVGGAASSESEQS